MLIRTYPPAPFPYEGKGAKKERGLRPLSIILPPLLKGEGDTGVEVRRSTKTEQNQILTNR